LAKLISFLGKTFFSWQKLYFFLAKILSLDKTYIFSWLNFFLLAKPIFFGNFFSIDKTYKFSWQFFFFWQNLYLFLAKLLCFDKTYIYFWFI